MPAASVWLIRTALAYLVAGFGLGTALLAAKGNLPLRGLRLVLPLHIEAVLIGAMLQFTMGTAFWLLPRFREGPPRGDERPVWAAYLLLNAGIWLAAGGRAVGADGIALSGRAGELLAALCFAWNVWPRVKGFGTS